ncbi:50S ribosomal protein L24 [Brachyspira aalborgi]|jgi:large subunit ribosomal protein L24|uniref:Large ribosomal subunit protein uL24 n=1 Tax=Brachyspira aalborgi TaxID=29522 RepID=A0AB38PY19_9SPIR|nr:50S ribosomal protein L24 [Brachyspira aalborgi]MBS4763010.1 50S ribosomal protein L24 [Brachyspira sp.]CCY76260.1 50S ribosomal protein L24 [Brachyspira sp. CAG:700]TXJ14418.1 50S ribosomal protein L24 [Brachyspira aalborgi]TXJ19196.1 50S ribosomal protein L24 [Brachyspira aalborgi]TXJ25322.1 50S ribosomal protein L24 [Brachyspira aalborgi]
MIKKLNLSNTKYKVKKGDTVEVITGEHSGKRGEVLSIDRAAGRVLVKDINMIKKTMPKSQENQKGGIVEREASIHISNVMVVDKSGKASRIGMKNVDGKLKRYSKKSGEVLDK